MSKNKHFKPDGKEFLKLTKWELGNLHLPPVTTVTLYEGVPPATVYSSPTFSRSTVSPSTPLT